MIEIDNTKCTGCGMCGELCPVGAITFEVNDGFRYPVVLKEKCISCGRCINNCPSLNKTSSDNMNPKVFAAYIKDIEQRVKCTSGGICYALSQHIIETGGYVAGVVWDDDLKDAHYELVNSSEGLDRITQTKYIQPKMNSIYSKIEDLLKAGNKVLYIGTACTNAALKNFLNTEYDNLYSCDFICRGYTSQIYHEKRLSYLEKKYSSKAVSFQYKNKDRGWSNFGSKVCFDNGKVYYINRSDDPYELMCGVDDYNTRPSCYNCKYRVLPRATDITLGDFWGIEKMDNGDTGISVVMISTKKGEELLDNISPNLVMEERTVLNILAMNPSLLKPLKRNEGAETFFSDIEKMDFGRFNAKYGKVFKVKLKKRMRRIMIPLNHILRCNILTYIYYNHICRKVDRKKGCHIYPYKGTRIDLNKKAKLILNGDLYLNFPKHRGSKEETYLKIGAGGSLTISGKSKFAGMNTIEIAADAKMETGSIDCNYGTTIICGNEISIGDHVGIGRNVTIYDNNFHATSLNTNKKCKPLIIEDNVWLCTGVTIAKGIRIEKGAVCSINSTIARNVKAKTMVAGNPAKPIMTNVERYG